MSEYGIVCPNCRAAMSGESPEQVERALQVHQRASHDHTTHRFTVPVESETLGISNDGGYALGTVTRVTRLRCEGCDEERSRE